MPKGFGYRFVGDTAKIMNFHFSKHPKLSKGAHKIGKVLGEFKRGTLRSGSGAKVKSRKQAVAIALSEARRAGARIPKKKGR